MTITAIFICYFVGLIMLSCPFSFFFFFSPDTKSKWGMCHRAFGIPPPHSALADLHYPAFAFPTYTLLFLPEQPLLRPPNVPFASRKLSTNQFREGPQEAGANHWGGISGLTAVSGAIELQCDVSQSKSLTALTCSWTPKEGHLKIMFYFVGSKKIMLF